MDGAPVSLRRESFAAAFPFSFVVGEGGAFDLVGVGLARRLGAEDTPCGAFEVLQPTGANIFEEPVRDGTTVRLRLRSCDLELKGQVTVLDEGARTAVLATPVVRTLDHVRESGLQLLDFPPHDSTPDLLLTMQAARTALEDARALSGRLERALDDAQTAVEAKSRFLAVMSHELRTPMNGVGSMVDLLMGSGLNEEQTSVLATIDHCARTLHTLVDDILDYSKLEADGVEIESIPFDVGNVIREAAQLFEASADERGVGLTVEVSPGVPSRVLGDPHRVRQVATNLISNAVKFTSAGSIALTVARDGELLSVEIRDTGCGIPEAARATLFDPFTQGDASTTRSYGGTGLGLTICRDLARLMGGDVSLIESSSAGTVFKFSFRFAEATRSHGESKAQAPKAPVSDVLQGRSILVVEDNPTNRLVAQRLLAKLGIEATVAEDGAEAIDAVQQRPFDLVLMDLMMPNVDGATATRAIRQLDVPWSQLPIVAFSAGAFEEDREVAASAGMQGFLQKPVRLERLKEALVEHLPG